MVLFGIGFAILFIGSLTMLVAEDTIEIDREGICYNVEDYLDGYFNLESVRVTSITGKDIYIEAHTSNVQGEHSKEAFIDLGDSVIRQFIFHGDPKSKLGKEVGKTAYTYVVTIYDGNGRRAVRGMKYHFESDVDWDCSVC